VDTGALSQSIAVQTAHESDYGDRLDTMAALRPGVVTFPEPPPPGPDAATVTSAAIYARYVNGGTYRMPARPFWDSARLETEAALGADAEAEWQA
jgi:hypothetical protein